MDEFILDKYTYNPATGAIVNKKRGYVKTRPNANGYLEMVIRGKHYYQHRLAWFIYTGTWPDQVDHINGVKTDNRMVNLRSVSFTDNMRNRPMNKSNTSGQTGVVWCKQINRWKASIYEQKKRVHIGTYLKLDDAITARKQAEREFGYHPNHGRTKNSPTN